MSNPKPRLLVFTQKMDRNDAVLGFFHNWVVKMAERSESVSVICLYKGECDLPTNVAVYSLGKELGVGRWTYIKNFYKYLYNLKGFYSKVFVHMNQEYVLLGGLYWKLVGVPVYMWRNHPANSFMTRIAVWLSHRTFCTSKASFVARYKKNTIMPVGNDTDMFRPISGVLRKKHSICMLGRVSPIKHVDLGLRTVKDLVSAGAQVSMSVVGSSLDRDMEYHESLKRYVEENGLTPYISFYPELPLEKHPEVFSSHELSLNLTDSGSFDKTILGSVACGAIPLVANESLVGLLPSVCITERDPKKISEAVIKLLEPKQQIEIKQDLEKFSNFHSLNNLIIRLFEELE